MEVEEVKTTDIESLEPVKISLDDIQNVIPESPTEYKLNKLYKALAFIGLVVIIASIISTFFASLEELTLIPELDLTRCSAITNNNKRIWAYWHGGAKEMPIFIQQNIKMWKHTSPDWEIRVIEGVNSSSECHFSKFLPEEHIPKDFHNSLSQKQSDYIRLGLIKLYGGVYMDSTVLLFEPLEPNFWNHVDLPSDHPDKKDMVGYYNRAFSKPGTNNGFEIWMIVAQAQNPLISAWYDLYKELVKDSMNPFIRDEKTGEMNKLFNKTDLSYLNPDYLNYGASTTALKALLQLNPYWNDRYVNKSIMRDVDDDAYKVGNYNFFQPKHLYNFFSSPASLTQHNMKLMLKGVSLSKLISHAYYLSDDKYEEWNRPYNILTLWRIGMAKKGKKYRETGKWDHSIWV